MSTLRSWSAVLRLSPMSVTQESVAPNASMSCTGSCCPSTVTVTWLPESNELFCPLPPIVTDQYWKTQGQGTKPSGGQALFVFGGTVLRGNVPESVTT